MPTQNLSTPSTATAILVADPLTRSVEEPAAFADALLTPAEAASRLAVNPRTLARWSGSGRLPVIRTLGGHRRYRAEDIDAIATPTA